LKESFRREQINKKSTSRTDKSDQLPQLSSPP
jgi:hypothetical protein